MALKPCRECKTKVSSKAKICPNCGIPKPVKGGASLIWIILIIVIIFVVLSPKNETTQQKTEPMVAIEHAEKQLVEQNPISTTELEVELNASVVSNNGKPIIKINSNLPEGTLVMASLANPINKGGGYYGDSKSSLNDEKSADVGPFSQNGSPLAPGIYMAVVSIGSLLQPKSVQSIIGNNGENLKGNTVFMLAGVPGRMVWQRYVFELTPDGAIINFNRSENSDADSALIPIE